MTAPAVSVVIVSHGRPASLGNCLTGVGQIDYPNFEIVIVADQSGIAAVKAHALGDQVKLVLHDAANISTARNAGIAASAGEIVAFIDDDAVPEPTWLSHLIAPFADEGVAAAGGYVIGRNGISFQWKARTVYPDAHTEDLLLKGDAPQVFEGSSARAIKTEGTNMAVRRDVLERLGGFDPAFHFYLDETDLNMRIGVAGLKTAIVPLAQVHHGFAESTRRSADRVPATLYDIGASLAVYLRKHKGNLGAGAIEREVQVARMRRFVAAARCTDRHATEMLATFDEGWNEGLKRDFGAAYNVSRGQKMEPFLSPMQGNMVIISGRTWQRKAKLREARKAVARGSRVSVYLFSLSARYHSVCFVTDGFWLQTGGLFGKSHRTDPIWTFWTFKKRLEREAARVASLRNVNSLVTGVI